MKQIDTKIIPVCIVYVSDEIYIVLSCLWQIEFAATRDPIISYDVIGRETKRFIQ